MKRLKTKRLYLTPLSDIQLSGLLDAEHDPEARADLERRRSACRENSKERLWHTTWQISLKDGAPVGAIAFAGPPELGAVELICHIIPARQGQGYATEAMKAILEWAFEQENVYYLLTPAAANNLAWQRVLDNLEFAPPVAERREKEKAASAWMSIYMMIGLSVGLSFGLALGNMVLGMGCGLPLGVLVGLWLDKEDKKQRNKLRAAREEAAGNNPAEEGKEAAASDEAANAQPATTEETENSCQQEVQ